MSYASLKKIVDKKNARLWGVYGSILESNKLLRRKWEVAIEKRDNYLKTKLEYLLPFLSEKVRNLKSQF